MPEPEESNNTEQQLPAGGNESLPVVSKSDFVRIPRMQYEEFMQRHHTMQEEFAAQNEVLNKFHELIKTASDEMGLPRHIDKIKNSKNKVQQKIRIVELVTAIFFNAEVRLKFEKWWPEWNETVKRSKVFSEILKKKLFSDGSEQ